MRARMHWAFAAWTCVFASCASEAAPTRPLVLPGGEASTHSWRATRPTFYSGWPAMPPPPIREGHLSNGMTVYLAELPDARTVQASVLSLAGSNLDPDAKPGLAEITWTTML